MAVNDPHSRLTIHDSRKGPAPGQYRSLPAKTVTVIGRACGAQ